MRYVLQGQWHSRNEPLSHHLSQWVDQVLGGGYHHYSSEEAWTPCLNLYEDRAAYHVVVDLSGVAVEEIELELHKGRLTISGHRQPPRPPNVQGEVKLHHMEIDHGPFCRKLNLPSDVIEEDIAAVYRSGQLHISLPKKS